MSDYLWDKTGEPDSEVERLEELLGTLRHDSRRELELPVEVVTPKRAPFRSPFAAVTAVAAALVLIALAMTMWRGVLRHGGKESDAAQVAHKKSDEQSSGQSRSEQQLASDDAGTRGPTEGGLADNGETSVKPRVSAPHLPAVTGRRGALPFAPRNAAQRQRKRGVDARFVHAAEMAAAERAKEQLMVALQVASAKFNLAQRKAPGISDVSPGGGNNRNDLIQQNRAR